MEALLHLAQTSVATALAAPPTIPAAAAPLSKATKAAAVVNSAKRSESIRLERNKTPTQSEIDEMVCFHWYTSSVKCI
jgi:hypothetical protein